MPFLRELEGKPGLIFNENKLPQKENGRWVRRHAPELDPLCAARMWAEMNKAMGNSLDRADAQVVVLTDHAQCVITSLRRSLGDSPLGKCPTAVTLDQRFPDGEFETRVVNEAVEAQSVYLVASVLTPEDFSRVRRVADHYKNTLNAGCVTLIAPFFGTTRQDKNVDRYGNYKPVTINIRAEIGGLAPFVDRIVVLESHSSATQYDAAKFGIPLVSLSPWKYLIEHLTSRSLPVEEFGNLVVIRPDNGRVLAARRVESHLKTTYVSFEKTRVSGEEVEVFELAEEEQAKIKGAVGIIYDDEISTMGTIERIARAMERYGAKALVVCVAHGKFTPGWEKRIEHPLLRIVICTDSRAPVGNIALSDKIKVVSLVPLIRRIIEADVNGVDFYMDEEWRQMVL